MIITIQTNKTDSCFESIDYPYAGILVVDDGSTDDSTDVIKDYITTHSNVQLIRKDNRGVSSSRNVFFGGRLAEYKYYDMAPTVERAMELAIRVLK